MAGWMSVAFGRAIDEAPVLREALEEASGHFDTEPGEPLGFDIFNSLHRVSPKVQGCSNPLQDEVINR